MKKNIYLIAGLTIICIARSNSQTFTKITSTPISAVTGNKEGVAWADYNNDGFEDLYVSKASGTNYLFRNDKNGSFTQITTGAIVTDNNKAFASSWGDYDNDGDLDCYSCNYGNSALPQTGAKANTMYRNEGSGSFIKMTSAMGHIVTDKSFTSGCTWGDYDNDGNLDMFVTNHSFLERNFLYRNNGNQTFSLITDNAIATDVTDIVATAGNSAAWCDYNNDGKLDLLVAERKGNKLYKNLGNGNFSKEENAITDTWDYNCYGASWADYDNDGDMDVFMPTFVMDYGFEDNDFNENLLYRNDGNGIFTKVTSQSIVTDQTRSTGSSWGDYDNDGDLDLFVSNYYGDDNLLYRNNGNGSFTKITTGIMVNDGGQSTGCAWADYDNDGDLDMVVANSGSNFLYRNDYYGDNSSIEIKCVGTTSNQSAIGTKVFVTATINGQVVTQMREISGQTGYSAQNSLRVHFGLGNASSIASILVKWPSGQQCTFNNVAKNSLITITEGGCTMAIDQAFYCKSKGTSQYEWIQNVELEPASMMDQAWINNNSGNNGGYAYFGNHSTALTKGEAYYLICYPGFSGSSYSENFNAWIDFNRDGDFNDANENVFSEIGNSYVYNYFDVPTNAISGATVMRVSMAYNISPYPCEESLWGEVEDYPIHIVNPKSKIINNETQNITGNSDLNFEIYPNPTADVVNLKINIESLPSLNVVVYNSIGQQIFQMNGASFVQNGYQLDLAMYPAGIYYIAVSDGKKIMTHKLILTK